MVGSSLPIHQVLDLKELVDKINLKVSEANDKKPFEFKLGVSIGYGRFEESYIHFDKFMHQIDQMMYQKKHKE